MIRKSTCALAVLSIGLLSSCSSEEKKTAATPESKEESSSSSSSSSSEPKNAPDVNAPNPVYVERGPHEVGVTTLTLGDRKVEVWYPATEEAVSGKTKESYSIRSWLTPIVDGMLNPEVNPLFETDAYRDVEADTQEMYPLVLFRHGYSGYRDQSTFLTTHLASWGFVVASPDQREIGLEFLGGVMGAPEAPRDEIEVMQATVSLVRAESEAPEGLLHGIVKDGPIGVTGHSAGGFASAKFAAGNDVAVYVPLAAGIGGSDGDETASVTAPDVPSMFIFGDIDTVVMPEISKSGYAKAASPTRLVGMTGSGHLNGFSDICEIGAEGGGIVKLAIDNGLPVPERLTKLGTDGCQAEAVPSEQLWPITNHFVTAMMRYYLGLDEEPQGLNEATAESFMPIKVSYSERLSD